MGWWFGKSFRLGKGTRLNVSNRGISTSFGTRKLRFRTGTRGSGVSSKLGPLWIGYSFGRSSGCGGIMLLGLLFFAVSLILQLVLATVAAMYYVAPTVGLCSLAVGGIFHAYIRSNPHEQPTYAKARMWCFLLALMSIPAFGLSLLVRG